MSNILITGGTGYIGSHIALELLKNNFNVFIIDNLSNSFETVINAIEKISEDDENARIIFQSTLFEQKDLSKSQINEINEEFMRMNPILNLSALALVNESYVIYGELSASSTEDNIISTYIS